MLKHKSPSNNATFEEWLVFFMNREGISQSALARRARISQSEINKIINYGKRSISIDVLARICMSLQLDLKESLDLMSRKEKTFSPANNIHQKYVKEIEKYSTKKIDARFDSNFLDEAQQDLNTVWEYFPIPELK